MKTKHWIILLSVAIPGIFCAAFINKTQDEDCIVKTRSAWGLKQFQCTKWVDSYAVTLKNNCKYPLDVMVCVQESNKHWRNFNFTGLASNDTLVAYACEGTGKYLYWTKRAGDTETKFPTIQEVDAKYKE